MNSNTEVLQSPPILEIYTLGYILEVVRAIKYYYREEGVLGTVGKCIVAVKSIAK